MRVTFLGHSGFFLELPEADLLFDYYKGELPVPDPERPLFVFVSHAHADHFSRKIFSLAEKTERICYILSDDIQKSKVPESLKALGKVRFTGPEEDFTVGETLRVRTFLSTDEGVAFLVDAPGARIYHAGDLND